MQLVKIELKEAEPAKRKKKKQNIRDTFPKVYKLRDGRTGKPYWLVDARSKKWGMNDRPTYGKETEALDRARAIARQIERFGAQPEISKENLILAEAYQAIAGRLAPFGMKPEEAVSRVIKELGEEVLQQAKPPIKDLADTWKAFKLTDMTLSSKYKTELKQYCRFIKRTWGDSKPQDPKKNEIDVLLRKLKCTNNTRRKYLRYVRMFFSWVKDEGHLLHNPTDGIKYKPDDFDGGFYTPEVTSRLLRYVVEHLSATG